MSAKRTPRVFLDTSALKFAADRLILGREIMETVAWGGRSFSLPVVRYNVFLPNERAMKREKDNARKRAQHGTGTKAPPKAKRPSRKLESELPWLRCIGDLAQRGLVTLVTHEETLSELRRLPRHNAPAGLFFGAPVERVHGPVYQASFLMKYIRPGEDDPQLGRISRLSQPRFKDICHHLRVTRTSRTFRNELLDAFHVWSAERAKADYFLTLDFKLLNKVGNAKNLGLACAVVTPHELTRVLLQRRSVSHWDLLRFVATRVIKGQYPRSQSPLEELVRLGDYFADTAGKKSDKS